VWYNITLLMRYIALASVSKPLGPHTEAADSDAEPSVQDIAHLCDALHVRVQRLKVGESIAQVCHYYLGVKKVLIELISRPEWLL
jgi:hypothetical protein